MRRRHNAFRPRLETLECREVFAASPLLAVAPLPTASTTNTPATMLTSANLAQVAAPAPAPTGIIAILIGLARSPSTPSTR